MFKSCRGHHFPLPLPHQTRMKTTLLVMAINEIDGMKAIMLKVDLGWVDQIILCDGGSADGTVEWAKA